MAKTKKEKQTEDAPAERTEARKPWELPEIGEIVQPGERVTIPTTLPLTTGEAQQEEQVFVTLSGSIGPRGGPLYGPGRVPVPRSFAEQLGVRIEGTVPKSVAADAGAGEGEGGDTGDETDYESWTVDELKTEAEARGVAVERGDGEEGAPRKADYVAALQAQG